ncbi:hypothetical protein H8B09_02985 [Paenibacillus sp. PR3]|uniref:DUF2269 family protein n=1 Tax=Paenibacillus terricola TaxID=2763503 RepID=A0ABR8MU81_9BACL|nr:hypothetical protein [Paenibacillus terricola]MBD3917704.1 hypothetical protein [Paenibacillus terricola]
MFNIMIWLHVIGAAGMGIYLIMPLLVGQATKLTGAGQEGLAAGLSSANRIAQYALIVQLLTGGYLMSQGDYSTLWMIIITLIFLAIGALSGIMGKPLKGIGTSIREGKSATAHIAKARVLSIIILVLYAAIMYLMTNPFS